MKTETAKHTPGTWRIGDAGHTVFGPPNDTPSPEIIAQRLKKANARLIASAPDLLEALKAVMLVGHAGTSDDEIEKAYKLGCKAIAKAEKKPKE